MGSIPVRDSEVFSSQKKKLVTTTITLSQCCDLLRPFAWALRVLDKNLVIKISHVQKNSLISVQPVYERENDNNKLKPPYTAFYNWGQLYEKH